MSRYYTRVCNFYYGAKSRALVKDKKSLPLNGIDESSCNQIEIISRKSKKIISLDKISKLPIKLKKKIKNEIKLIIKKKKKYQKFKF